MPPRYGLSADDMPRCTERDQPTGRRGLGCAYLLLGSMLLSACTMQGAFRQDHQLVILAPENRSIVRLPVTLRWSVRNFQVARPDGSTDDRKGRFGVFIDRSLMPPGRSLAYLAKDDIACRRTPGCPDEAWFAAHGIYLTTNTSFTIDALPDMRPEERPEALDRHEVVIVLLNGRDRRIGESAYRIEFTVDRGGQG